MSKTTYIVSSIEFKVHEEDWNNGEGNLMCVWNEDLCGSFNSIQDLLADIPYQEFAVLNEVGDQSWLCDFCHEGDYSRFDADFIVGFKNESVCSPTEDEVKAYKEGKQKLYALHVKVRVQKVCNVDRSEVPEDMFD